MTDVLRRPISRKEQKNYGTKNAKSIIRLSKFYSK